MQSATSFFNRALFRKNLQRFWPLWLGYVLIWLLLLPLPLLNELADYHGVPTVADASYYLLQIGAYGGLVMGAVFGIFFAMAMFAYLTNPRATQGFHSMPVRRETLYATNYLTGLVCMVSALVLAFALAGITAACFGALNLTALGTALLAAVLSVLFFYSFAVLCMMFTGQILAAPVFYGILNFLAVGMEYLVRTFAGNFLYGYSGYSAPETFAFLSPAWELVCVLDVSNVARVDRILSDGTYQVIRGRRVYAQRPWRARHLCCRRHRARRARPARLPPPRERGDRLHRHRGMGAPHLQIRRGGLRRVLARAAYLLPRLRSQPP